MRIAGLAGFCVATLALAGQAPPREPRELSKLESKATAVLAARCLGCHGAVRPTAGLSLASLGEALKGGSSGRAALVAGEPQRSLLVTRVEGGEMPPGTPLPAAERELLRRWVAAGAPWTAPLSTTAAPRAGAGRDWWSLAPLRRVQPPPVEGMPAEWTRFATDRFLHRSLREKGLEPAPPADRRTLIRRATFDLLGLPPTPEEVEAFVSDPRADAYERLVDRLLASPHYGERWGLHWLDVVRFGESHGYEQNHLRDAAWHYRDWVIRAFNEDKPFDRMVVEQLAGDRVGAGNPAVEVATGFLVAGMHDTVKIQNVDGELQKRANDLDDMVSTTATAFLGLTVGCARCHDHKFDPISQVDYYRMQAAFAGVEHGSRVLATPEQRSAQRAVEEPLRKRIEAANLLLEAMQIELRPKVEARRAELARAFRPPVDSRGTEESFAPVPARFVRMTITQTLRRSPPALDELELFDAAGRNVARGGRASARSTRAMGAKSEFYRAEHVVDGAFDKTWISGEAGAGQITLELPEAASVVRVRWSRDRLGANQGRFLSMLPTAYTLEVSRDGRAWTQVGGSDGRLPYDEAEREELFLASVMDEAQRGEWTALRARKADLEARLSALAKLPAAYIGTFREPEEPTRLARRGNPSDRGNVVRPGSPGVLEGMLPGYELDPAAPEGERRLRLAQWITHERNALAARVLANRVWQYHFGRGVVDTPGDFGKSGARPSHPELLEWLAGRVLDLGWRLKPLHREIMLSAAYRQSSRHDPRAAAVDRDAVLLWRFPPRRLGAEEVWDALLAASGRLDRRMGGPGFRLYTYSVDNVASYGPRQSYGAETYRRALYHQAARSVKPDLLGPFDCPDSSLPAPKRAVTVSPLQAFSLLNNAFVLDQAGFFAKRVRVEAGPDLEAQVRRAYALVFGRPPGTDAGEARALASRHGLWILCRALFNANEFVHVP